MKYCLMLEDGQYIESNFTLIVINAHQAGHLDNLVVLYPITSFHSDLDIEPQTVIIVDPSKNYLSRNMTLVKVSKNMIQEPYLEYLSRHEMDGTTKSNCCNSDIIENTDLCSDCKEHSIPKVSKEDWRRRDKIKSKIKDITSIYFDTFDVLENCNQLGLVNFMKNNNIKTFQELVLKIKKFLIPYGYTILHRKSVWVNFDTNGTMDVKHSVSDGIGKFFIIKNEEKYLEKVLTKPITIYANKDEIGYIIGNQGKSIKDLMLTFNGRNRFWKLPYITIKPLEERKINNDELVLRKQYSDLLEIIFSGK